MLALIMLCPIIGAISPWQQSPIPSGLFVLHCAWLTPASKQMRPLVRVVCKRNFCLDYTSHNMRTYFPANWMHTACALQPYLSWSTQLRHIYSWSEIKFISFGYMYNFWKSFLFLFCFVFVFFNWYNMMALSTSIHKQINKHCLRLHMSNLTSHRYPGSITLLLCFCNQHLDLQPNTQCYAAHTLGYYWIIEKKKTKKKERKKTKTFPKMIRIFNSSWIKFLVCRKVDAIVV